MPLLIKKSTWFDKALLMHRKKTASPVLNLGFYSPNSPFAYATTEAFSATFVIYPVRKQRSNKDFSINSSRTFS